MATPPNQGSWRKFGEPDPIPWEAQPEQGSWRKFAPAQFSTPTATRLLGLGRGVRGVTVG